jgi:nitroimidazol reductase NimA-like FMN-containing flavoprotein (pyridoxamine 5'-phosphate oxidase superfamily)
MADRRLAEVPRGECVTLLRGASFGRLGVSIDAVPAILPVLIALHDDSVVFQTVPGTKLAAAASNTVVALEVDDFDPERREGWSVLVRGIASVITDPERRAQACDLLDGSWIVDGSAQHLVSVSLDLVTGRRLHGADTATIPTT